MNLDENNSLDILFQSAREEAPKLSFEDTKGVFLKSLALGGAGLLTAKGLAYLIKLKFSVIMFSTIGIVATTAVIMQVVNPTPEKINQSISGEKIELSQNNPEIISPEVILIDQDDSLLKNENEVIVPEVEMIEELPTFLVTEFPMIMPKSIEPVKPSVISTIQSPRLLAKAEVNEEMAADIVKYQVVVTEKTTDKELLALEEKALAAGIDYTYSAKRRGNNIKKLTIKMIIYDEDGERKVSTFYLKNANSFNFQIGWMELDGKATGFIKRDNCCNNTTASICIDTDEIEASIEKSVQSLEVLIEKIELELSEDSLELEKKMEELEQEIERKVDELEIKIENTNWEINCQDSMMDLGYRIDQITNDIDLIIEYTIDNIESSEVINEGIDQIEIRLIEIENQIKVTIRNSEIEIIETIEEIETIESIETIEEVEEIEEETEEEVE